MMHIITFIQKLKHKAQFANLAIITQPYNCKYSTTFIFIKTDKIKAESKAMSTVYVTSVVSIYLSS